MPYWICIFRFSLGAAILMLYQGCSTWSLFLIGELSQFVWGLSLAGVLALEKVQCFMGSIAWLGGAQFVPFFSEKSGSTTSIALAVHYAVHCHSYM